MEASARLSSLRSRSEALSMIPLLAVAGAFVLLYAPTMVWLWGKWTQSVWHNAHGLLVAPFVAYTAYVSLKSRPDLPVAPARSGFLFLAAGLTLRVIDAGLGTELLSAASLIVVTPGLALLLMGRERTALIAFPLAFLVFMLPLPLAATERLHLLLRIVSARATEALIGLFMPIFREGTTLHIANAALQVADACSGFSTLYAACAVAALTAYSCRSASRRLTVLLIAAPLAIAANILRVSLLVLLVYWQGSDVLATSLHTVSGLATFALVLPVIFWLGNDPPRSVPHS